MRRIGRHPGARGILPVVVLAAVVLAGLPPAPAVARGAACSFDPGTHVDSVVESGSATIVHMSVSAGTIMVNNIACGTVNTVDTIHVDMGGFVNVRALIDLSGGAFAPGFTDEPGTSDEIEFTVENLAANVPLDLEGTGGPDSITLGQHVAIPAPIPEINLNAAQDGSSPDFDVEIFGRPPFIDAGLFGGDDSISAAGTGVGSSGPLSVPIAVADGPGADLVTGGTGDDAFQTEDTPDQGDAYSGGAGRDTLEMFQTDGVHVSQDGKPNDGHLCPGPSCEGDDVSADIERLLVFAGNNTLSGGPGAQELSGGNGECTLQGGPGNDVLVSGSSDDVLRGGPGVDTVNYEGHTHGIRVSLDGTPNDGVPGEHDNVGTDVEAVVGGQGNDRIVGNGKANRLSGYLGNDVLIGGGGNDRLDGGGAPTFPPDQPDGSDALIGGPGTDTVVEDGKTGGLRLSIDGVKNDQVKGDPSQGVDNIRTDIENVIGGPFDDVVTGSAAANRLEGRAGRDVLRGLGGDDALEGDAGNDALDGGPGVDRCVQGPGTGPRTSCEH